MYFRVETDCLYVQSQPFGQYVLIACQLKALKLNSQSGTLFPFNLVDLESSTTIAVFRYPEAVATSERGDGFGYLETAFYSGRLDSYCLYTGIRSFQSRVDNIHGQHPYLHS